MKPMHEARSMHILTLIAIYGSLPGLPSPGRGLAIALTLALCMQDIKTIYKAFKHTAAIFSHPIPIITGHRSERV